MKKTDALIEKLSQHTPETTLWLLQRPPEAKPFQIDISHRIGSNRASHPKAAMLVKCICTNCAGHLEFEEENAGEEIQCPHCRFDTKLFLPGTQPDAAERSGLIQKLWGRRKPLVSASAVLLVAGIGFAMYRWVLTPLKDWLPYTESKILPVLALGVFCLVIVALVVWLVLPVLLFLQLGKITRVLAQIETNLRPTLPVYPPSEEELVNENVDEASPLELPSARSHESTRPTSLTPPREQL